jgi:hypothetical protein
VQNAKDTFYEILRERLSAVNPERTIVVRGVMRPGVLVEENQFVVAAILPDCFRLRWTEMATESNGAMPLVMMQCVVDYETAGSTANSGMDRGRLLAAMDAELQSVLSAEPSCTLKSSFSGLSSGKPVIAMGTNIWWATPQFGKAEMKEDRIARSATVTVMSYQEAGEL